MSESCVLDSNGDCITHAPGTAGEMEQHRKIVDATLDTLNTAGNLLAEIGLLMTFASAMVSSRNEQRRERGQLLLRNTEQEVEGIVRPVAQAAMDAIDKLKALRDSASAPPETTGQN